MFVGFCMDCGKMLDDGKPEPEEKLFKNVLTLDELYERMGGTVPHYMCSECIKKWKDKVK